MTPSRPLLVVSDPELLDDLLRLCAAAGVVPDVAPDSGVARRSWSTAPLVLVGSEHADELVRTPLPRRSSVLLVATDLDDAGVWERAVRIGAEHVVFLPDGEPWLVQLIADSADGPRPAARTVCVVGGCGGAGATTLAAALSLTAVRRGLTTLLIDGDPLGGGIDLMLGAEDCAGLRWPGLASASGTVRGGALRDVLPSVGALTVLSWDRSDVLTVPVPAMEAVLDAARRGSDLVVVDLPRRVDEAGAAALARCDAALVVVPAQIRAVAAAARVAAALGMVAGEVEVVVRSAGAAGLAPAVVADSLGLPLAGHLRAEPGLDRALEEGIPPCHSGRGPLATFAGDFLDRMVSRPGRAA
ncbi:MAG: CpaE-like family protein [Actinomycetota bacterium]|nr:CpaE-like family protein [Actinomycetota bacterium]